MRRLNDTDLIRQGEAITEFNDNASTIFRLDFLKKQANIARGVYSQEGLLLHLSAIKGMELELAGKLTAKEVEELKQVKIEQLPFNKAPSPNILYRTKNLLETYEARVRELLQLKGLGVTAKQSKDPSRAILGDE